MFLTIIYGKRINYLSNAKYNNIRFTIIHYNSKVNKKFIPDLLICIYFLKFSLIHQHKN